MELITVFRLWLEPGQTHNLHPACTPARVSLHPRPIRLRAMESLSPCLCGSDFASHADFPQPAAQPKKPEPDKNITSLSIVQQIDTVLQEHLATSPLAGRGIRLQESIQGGVEVYVGLQKFETVDDVPDAEIKAAIRSAIAEWEKKYTPGM